eukprot:scaffold26080_cov43-Cyclotella_meneghiniana.AAC.2
MMIRPGMEYCYALPDDFAVLYNSEPNALLHIKCAYAGYGIDNCGNFSGKFLKASKDTNSQTRQKLPGLPSTTLEPK